MQVEENQWEICRDQFDIWKRGYFLRGFKLFFSVYFDSFINSKGKNIGNMNRKFGSNQFNKMKVFDFRHVFAFNDSFQID